MVMVMITLGCNDDEVDITPIEQFIEDTESIDQWIADNGIQDTLIDGLSHIRYTINEVGTGISPRAFSQDTILVNYEGRLLDTGEVFDDADGEDIELGLDATIRGWQIMLPKMKEGGDFTIYLPSLYGYGTEGRGSIPANAVLVFDIKLVRVGN